MLPTAPGRAGLGDRKQLQSIEAGAAFRSIDERHGGAEIGEVRRQREDWQRDATRVISPIAEPATRWKPIAPTAWCMRPRHASRRATI